MTITFPDVSEFQVPITGFAGPLITFRILSEWGRYDNNLATNLTYAKAQRGKAIEQFGGYVIPGLIPNSTILASIPVDWPHDAILMMDVESWNGQISGDHSAQFNELADALRARQGGRADLVWGYANMRDAGELWPYRPAWLGMIYAGYGSSQPPNAPNRVAWQYTDGVSNGTDMPSATAPFGNCDHNALYVPIPMPGDTLSQAEVDQIIAHVDAKFATVPGLVQQAAGLNASQFQQLFNAAVGGHSLSTALTSTLGNLSNVVTNPSSGTHVRVAALQAAVAALPPAPQVADIIAAVEKTLTPALVAAIPGVDPAVVANAITSTVPGVVGAALGKLALTVNLAGTAGPAA